MKEEDDMLELLDEDDLTSDSEESEDLELNDDTGDESVDEALELDDEPDEPENLDQSPGEVQSDSSYDDTVSVEESEPEREGFEIDVRYLIVAAVALGAILIGAVFFVMPMFADKAPVVSFTPSETGEDLFLYHSGGDSLTLEPLGVLINGAAIPADRYILENGAPWPWVPGAILKINTAGYARPATVTLTYTPRDTTYTIYGTTVQPTPTPTPLPTPQPVITPEQQVPVNGTPVSPGTAPSTGLTPPPVTQGDTLPVATPIPTLLPGSTIPVVMEVLPMSGVSPLTVQCNDLTGGCIRNRVWNFGDNQTSMKRNPIHVYPFPGTYTVSLDVRFCDPDDNTAEIPTKTVIVEPSVRHDSLAQGTGTARVLAGGTLYFSVKGPGTNIRIGGRDHYLNPGDNVELALGSAGSGDISVVSNAILRCNYSNATMSVNGEEVITGTISVINIDQYMQFETANLNIQVLAGRDGAKGLVDGQPVINAAKGQQLSLKNVGVDSTGKLLFSVQDGAGFSFRGGIGSYEVTTPPPL